MNLLDETYQLIDSTPETYREIAAGAEVDFNWLIKFGSRSIGSPGVLLVQRVHDYLAKGRKSAKTSARRRSQSKPRRMREAANA